MLYLKEDDMTWPTFANCKPDLDELVPKTTAEFVTTFLDPSSSTPIGRGARTTSSLNFMRVLFCCP
jgi:hypothetical protein